MNWQFWIDVGGTFTDCVALSPVGELRTSKTLSSGRIKGVCESLLFPGALLDGLRRGDPDNFWRGWTFVLLDELGQPAETSTVRGSNTEGLLQLADELKSLRRGSRYELRCDVEAPVICMRYLLGCPLDTPLPPVDLRMGTTRGTNALLERNGARTALLVTRGFADLLRIANQDRPELFSLEIRKPAPLAENVLEVSERLAADGTVIEPLDESRLRADMQQLRATGVQSLAVCLLHAYRTPTHELRVEQLAREAGFTEISLSHKVSPTIKAVPRAETTVVDAYLNPILRVYLSAISRQLGTGSTLKMMTSLGGLVDAAGFSGKDSILSGPAGGVIATTHAARAAGFSQAIAFDMGGTSTDVSRCSERLTLEYETVKAGARIAAPLLAIETVAAGGGSVCWFDGARLRVGPHSAGSDPGPACYGRGGPLSITDINVFLSRVLATHFPFPLEVPAISQRLDEVRLQMESTPAAIRISREDLAQGFLDIANETMAGAIRQISIRQGYNPADHVLVSFGGAGGQHACALARELGFPQVLIHPLSGVFSALGMGLAAVRRRASRPVLQIWSPAIQQQCLNIFTEIEPALQKQVRQEGVADQFIAAPVRSWSVRYVGAEASIDVITHDGTNLGADFEAQHQQLFGYVRPGRELEIVSIASEVVGQTPPPQLPVLPPAKEPLPGHNTTQVWSNGTALTAVVHQRSDLRAGHQFQGPALLCDAGATLWLEPGFQAEVRSGGEILLSRLSGAEGPRETGDQIVSEVTYGDPVQLEIFNRRFASIAEQMGLTLRKTALSTNVKERLDYSCALFDAAGGIVVNAPHIPVHLGAMGESVRCILRDNPRMQPGDVFLTNDPYAGGSHLPDLTAVTPVHDPLTGELLFLTASRAHHAEIGGMTPGSMPPFSTRLGEEGVLVSNFKIVDAGISRMEEFDSLLRQPPFPSRSPQDNLADVAAQIAANQLGARLLLELVRQSSLTVVRQQMRNIQQSAAAKMRQALRDWPAGAWNCTDFLDDGTPIVVTITIAGDTALIDFTGTGDVLANNLNGNRAIVTAAVMYVFRCLLQDDIPLNSGVLEPLTIILPECLLNPSPGNDRANSPAVVGGNVETSQRVVDVLLGALGRAAASQGTMNNFSFGNRRFGYYETICGGAGATALADGADAVHTHMTNTRLTDVEVIEHRYPVRVEEFCVRTNSGGAGQQHGGQGVRRVVRFLEEMDVSLLTQRRGPYAPFGLQGGAPGELGRNSVWRVGDAEPTLLGSSAQLRVSTGDRIIIETPGGGGYGQR